MLGLIATTRQGADILKTLEWESVRHKGEDSWPVVEVKEEALPYSKWFVSSLSAATGFPLFLPIYRAYLLITYLKHIARQKSKHFGATTTNCTNDMPFKIDEFVPCIGISATNHWLIY